MNTYINRNGISLDKRILKKRAIIYLSFVYGFILLSWILSIIKESYSILLSFFSFFPFLSSLFTRGITKDKSPWMLRPSFRKNWRIYLIAAFLPSILIFLGGVLYFLIFPNHLDLSAIKLVEMYGKFGFPSNLPHTLDSIIKIGIVGVLISPFIVPVIIFAFGEEIGWRGYFLPILIELMGKKKAILLHSVFWGLGHGPLIYFGFNYGLDYWCAPLTGILMMILTCVVLGIWLSYVTIKSNSIIPASILHGSVNVIGEWPALVAISSINTLLGPNPTGIIGMVGLLIGAIVLLKGSTAFKERGGGSIMENIIIRQAEDKDMEEIKIVVKEAFYRPGKNENFNEWEFANKVREDSGFIPELCLIAILDDEIVGYNLLSKASIGKYQGLALGPIAVKPSYQGQGIGKKLMEYGLKKAEESGFKWVVLIGGDYYIQFGFEPALKYGIVLSDNHPENPYIKIRFFGSNREVFGEIKYCDSFYDKNGELL